MKKCKFLLLFIFMFVLLITSVDAVTIRETMDDSDNYMILENGSIIIGVTRFTPNKVVTASRAATAGADDVKLHILKNDNIDNYDNPGVYYYVDSYVGWFYLDSDNKATPITDEDELEKLSKLDIYYVDNVEKVLDIDVSNINVLENSLPDGVKYKDNKLYVNATISEFEIKTVDNEVIKFEFDSTTSKFISEKQVCYVVSEGMITSYNIDCGNEVIIPIEYNGDKITGIGNDAFKGINLVKVVIPNEIVFLGNNAFADNKLESVMILGKSSFNDFEYYGENVFGTFDKVVYEKKIMVDSITINKTELTLDVGDSETLVAEILPDDATDKDVVWVSGDINVVTVDDNGKVSAVGEGSTVITASVDGKSVECSVTVNKKVTYTYQWEKIDISIVDQYYLYIVDNNGNKVSGRVNIKYNNDKNKEFNISSEGIKIVKSAVSSVEIISID